MTTTSQDPREAPQEGTALNPLRTISSLPSTGLQPSLNNFILLRISYMSNTFTSLSPLHPPAPPVSPPNVYVYTHICAQVYNPLSHLALLASCAYVQANHLGLDSLCRSLSLEEAVSLPTRVDHLQLFICEQDHVELPCPWWDVNWYCLCALSSHIIESLGNCWEASYIEGCSTVYKMLSHSRHSWLSDSFCPSL